MCFYLLRRGRKMVLAPSVAAAIPGTVLAPRPRLAAPAPTAVHGIGTGKWSNTKFPDFTRGSKQ